MNIRYKITLEGIFNLFFDLSLVRKLFIINIYPERSKTTDCLRTSIISLSRAVIYILANKLISIYFCKCFIYVSASVRILINNYKVVIVLLVFLFF